MHTFFNRNRISENHTSGHERGNGKMPTKKGADIIFTIRFSVCKMGTCYHLLALHLAARQVCVACGTNVWNRNDTASRSFILTFQSSAPKKPPPCTERIRLQSHTQAIITTICCVCQRWSSVQPAPIVCAAKASTPHSSETANSILPHLPFLFFLAAAFAADPSMGRPCDDPRMPR